MLYRYARSERGGRRGCCVLLIRHEAAGIASPEGDHLQPFDATDLPLGDGQWVGEMVFYSSVAAALGGMLETFGSEEMWGDFGRQDLEAGWPGRTFCMGGKQH